MRAERVEGLKGWLLFYLIGSIFLMMFYSVGLSGFFFDYPFPLMLVIFLVLAVPLLLIPLKIPRAPQWNVAELWTIVVLMILRSLDVFLSPLSSEERPLTTAALSGVVAFSLGWAIVWTRYFKRSVRVENTFSR